jgi:integrase
MKIWTYKVKSDPCWRYRFYFGKTQEGKRIRINGVGTPDKDETERKAYDHVGRLEKGERGIGDESAKKKKMPIDELLAAWARQLSTVQQASAVHAEKSVVRVKTILDAIGAKDANQITEDSVNNWAMDKRESKTKKGTVTTAKTVNAYLQAVKAFTKWAFKKAEDPLARLERFRDAKGAKTTRPRRELSEEEQKWLLAATMNSPWVYRGLTGKDRCVLYGVAIATGFRAGELSSLTPEDFLLDHSDGPRLHLSAKDAKNGQETYQLFAKSVALALPPYLATKAPDKHIWPGNAMDYGSAVMIRKDLEAAKKAWIAAGAPVPVNTQVKADDFLAFKTADGRFADFHSLRAVYSSNAVRVATAKTWQQLVRHADPGLTLQRYAKTNDVEMAEAVEKMPMLALPDLR